MRQGEAARAVSGVRADREDMTKRESLPDTSVRRLIRRYGLPAISSRQSRVTLTASDFVTAPVFCCAVFQNLKVSKLNLCIFKFPRLCTNFETLVSLVLHRCMIKIFIIPIEFKKKSLCFVDPW